MNNESNLNDDELAEITGGTSETPATANVLGAHSHSVEVEEPDFARYEEPGLQRLTPEEARQMRETIGFSPVVEVSPQLQNRIDTEVERIREESENLTTIYDPAKYDHEKDRD